MKHSDQLLLAARRAIRTNDTRLAQLVMRVAGGPPPLPQDLTTYQEWVDFLTEAMAYFDTKVLNPLQEHYGREFGKTWELANKLEKQEKRQKKKQVSPLLDEAMAAMKEVKVKFGDTVEYVTQGAAGTDVLTGVVVQGKDGLPQVKVQYQPHQSGPKVVKWHKGWR